jgi:hypothetical protein
MEMYRKKIRRTSHRCQFGRRSRFVPAHESRPPASWQAGSVGRKKMNTKRSRIIGTTPEAIAKEEAGLGRKLPPSFTQWLIENNGLGIEGVNVFPVLDDRDPRKTWDSIGRQVSNAWAAWLENFEEEDRNFSHLLPFAEFGTGDFYCFDYSRQSSDGECEVVRWSHETGDSEFRAASFSEFAAKVAIGEFAHD